MDSIYEIFKKDFIDNRPIFEGKGVNFRKAPMDGKYEQTFIHLTHKDEYHNSSNPNDRLPDPRRAEKEKITTCLLQDIILNTNIQ